MLIRLLISWGSIFFWFLTKNRRSPKKFKVEKKWFLMPKIKNTGPLTYLDGFCSSNFKKNDIFLKKKFRLLYFFWTDNFIGTVEAAAFVFIIQKIPTKVVYFFACGFYLLRLTNILLWRWCLNFFFALLARSGRSKNNFLQFLVSFVDILVDFQNKESYNRRGNLK